MIRVSRIFRLTGAALLLGLGAVTGAARTEGTVVCGMPNPEAARPSDLGDGTSDLSLARIAEQPASLVTCSMGYLAAKCGDYLTANRIFDKCIAKGYVGAMLWKGQMHENGNGVPRDLAKAAELFRRAGESGHEQYAALGKLHYASALHEGRGVPRDETAARRWFEAAAAEGSTDAQEFLRTGYHTGARDEFGHGVGVSPDADATGRRLLRRVEALLPEAPRARALVLAALLALLVLAGAGWQSRRRHPAGG